MVEIDIQREYYSHDGDCSRDKFEPLNERGLKRCKDCSGVFDKNGNGVAVTDKRFDENWVEPTDD